MHILEIIIGIVFVMLLFSLLATTIMESISGIFALRGKNLVSALKHILAHDGDETLFREFQQSELYKQLCSKRKLLGGRYRPPSYMSANSFWVILSTVLFKDTGKNTSAFKNKLEELGQNDLLKTTLTRLLEEAEEEDALNRRVEKVKNSVEFLQNEEIKNQIINYAEGVEQKVTSFKYKVENWYDSVMDRTSGWYKRQTQLILFIIGCVIAGGFNADIIEIYQTLSDNPELAVEIADVAGDYLAKNPNVEMQKTIEELIKDDLASVESPLGIGWDFDKVKTYDWWDWIYKVFGWLITALSVTLGAPFWFDLLKKLVNIRSAGAKPASSTS